MKSRWTPEAREKQRQAIHRWKPWTRSTGPRTAQGKTQSALNGYWCGYVLRLTSREQLRIIKRILA